MIDNRLELERQLIANIKERIHGLRQLHRLAGAEWGSEDYIYRFYHQSFKVEGIQRLTLDIVGELGKLLPGQELNKWFREIVAAGTLVRLFDSEGRVPDHINRNWPVTTRPLLEAFFHANYFLSMIVKYGPDRELPRLLFDPAAIAALSPGERLSFGLANALPPGWAAVLHLYQIR